MTASPSTPPLPRDTRVQRQIVLPTSKAARIAYQSIRLRLSRSLLVTSGIVLALAFLMSILTRQAITDSMRQWAQNVGVSPAFDALRQNRERLGAQMHDLETEIRHDVDTATLSDATAPPSVAFNAKSQLGAELPELQTELGALPAPADRLATALGRSPALLPKMRQWIDLARQSHKVREELSSPQQLLAQMKGEGVPTTAEEISSNKIQTRWLVGLALLVAFAGILNAMLMSVTERFREIGTMKCLGALDSFIIKLFLIESLLQGFVGTTLGVVFGLILSIAGALSSFGQFVWHDFPTATIVMNVGICILVGIVLTVAGAVYPAWQAARMQPIEAMRSET